MKKKLLIIISFLLLANTNSFAQSYDFEYDSITNCGQYLIVNKNKKYALFDTELNKFIFSNSKQISKLENDTFFIKEKSKGKIYKILSDGSIKVFEGEYKSVVKIENNYKELYLAKNNNNRMAILNVQFKPLCPFKFKKIQMVDKNLIQFDNKYDFVSNLRLNFDPKFESVEKIYEDEIFKGYVAKRNNREILLDAKGYFINPFEALEDYPEYKSAYDLLYSMNRKMNRMDE